MLKRILAAILVILVMPVIPAVAQDTKNPSLQIQEVAIPWNEFNRVGRDASTILLDQEHGVSWQVTLINEIIYGNPGGNAVVRLYDAFDPDIFLEVGMGANPDRKFWLAAQLPREGYVVVHSKLDRGWFSGIRINLSYTDQGGLTVNNGERIVVSNLDVGTFTIGSYSVHGMDDSSGPPATVDGKMVVEFMSGNPSENIYALFPFILTAAVGVLVGVLYLSKRRS